MVGKMGGFGLFGVVFKGRLNSYNLVIAGGLIGLALSTNVQANDIKHAQIHFHMLL